MNILEVAIGVDTNTGKPVFFNALNNKRVDKTSFDTFDLVYYYNNNPKHIELGMEYTILYNANGPNKNVLGWHSLAVLREFMVFPEEITESDYKYADAVLKDAVKLGTVEYY